MMSNTLTSQAPSRALETLPFVHGGQTFSALPEAFYTRINPTPLPAPRTVAISDEAAALIGLTSQECAREEFAEYFCGNRLLPGSTPLAAVYSGHQFGVWAGQLGDGRAHSLGELATANGPIELQLKGAGQTPYSRFGDGRAVLRSSIREFLCSEAMAALGIPTTRALSIVGSPAPVMRETVETAAVVTRMSPSFVRFGSFEHWAANGNIEALHTLADHVIDKFYPALRDAPEPYLALLAEVSRNTATMIAAWQAVGFMHGVMNTDNMSILGLTIDYGPFGFMEAFDARHICNHSDTHGRYAYAMQPRVGHWNLYALGNAMAPLIGEDDKVRACIDEGYVPTYEASFLQGANAKLGFATRREEDEDFLGSTYGLLQSQRLDHTQFFRALSRLPGAPDETNRTQTDAPLRDHFIDREAGDAWLRQWRARLAQEARRDAERQRDMLAVNPKYILRNWIAESVIRKARAGDYSEIARVLQCLQKPFDEQPEFEDLAALPPDWASGLEVSCSS